MIDYGQPIGDWVQAQKSFSADDRAATLALVGVWTVGDLYTVLDAGEVVNAKLAAKLRKALGIRDDSVIGATWREIE